MFKRNVSVKSDFTITFFLKKKGMETRRC